MKFPFIHLIHEFAWKNKPDECKQAMVEVFGPPHPMPEEYREEIGDLFTEWLMFEFVQSSKATFIAEYALRNPDGLPDKELDCLRQIAQTHRYSYFALTPRRLRGKWIEVEDLFTGKMYRVDEVLGSQNLPPVGSVHARLAEVDDRYYFVGANPILMPVTHTERMKRIFRRDFKKIRPSAKDTIQLLLQKAAQPREAVHPPIPTAKEVKNKRKELRKRFEKLVFRYNLKLSFDEVAKRILDEDRVNVLDFFQKLADEGLGQEFLMNEIKLLEDMWNWLPHACLNGNAPVEMYAKLKRAEKKVHRS